MGSLESGRKLLVSRSLSCVTGSLQEFEWFLKATCKSKRYHQRWIRQVLHPAERVAVLSYIHTTIIQVSRMLSRHVRRIGLPLKKTASFLLPAKEHLERTAPGKYSIHCRCGHDYNGYTA